MQENNGFDAGCKFAAEVMGAYAGHAYVEHVKAYIEKLEKAINEHPNRNSPPDKFQGNVFEPYTVGVYNTKAAARGSRYRTIAPTSTIKNSSDVIVKKGNKVINEYSAKSYATGEQTAVEQTRFDVNSGKGSYHGMGKIVPADKLDSAKAEAHRRFLSNRQTRPDVSEAYHETELTLTDRISTEDGVESLPVTRKQLDKIAKAGQQQDFKAEDFDITIKNFMEVRDMLNASAKAGMTTAFLTIAFQLAPEIYKAIDYLIKNGELDLQLIKEMGVKGLPAGAEGFLRGFIASALQIMCEKGVFGEVGGKIPPSVLGVAVAIILQTAMNSILVATGKMSAQQMGVAFVDTVIVSGITVGGFAIGAKVGGIVGQSIGINMPIIGYLIGSLIGTAFCVVHNIGKNKLISLCVDTGCTCFGLVEQDYVLPKELLDSLKIETITIPTALLQRVDIPSTNIPLIDIPRVEYETIDFVMVRRGLMDVNKVGYICQ